jgi:hypothetical protein
MCATPREVAWSDYHPGDTERTLRTRPRSFCILVIGKLSALPFRASPA